MTRVNPNAASCKSYNHYTFGEDEEKQTASNPEARREPRRSPRAAEALDKIRETAKNARAKRAAERNSDWGGNAARVGVGAAAPRAADALLSGEIFGFGAGAGAAAVAAGAAGAIVPQLLLLRSLGKDHHDVQKRYEHKSYLQGMAETLGAALDKPELTPEQLLKRARASEHIDRLDTRARSRAWKERDRKWAAARMKKYMEGARRAAEWVRKLSAKDREALRAKLANKLAGRDSAARLMDLFNSREAIRL
jgi:hypothetical protein